MKVERFKLDHAPFTAPRVQLGETIYCAVHGPRPVVGVSGGPLPWPLVRPIQGGRPVPALTGDLLDAVRRESKQAIAHWWSVSGKTVWRWRCVLEVPEHNEGTLRLRRDYAAQTLQTKLAKARAAAATRDPKRRARASALWKGRRRPPAVIAKMRAALLGRQITPEWRRRISDQKRRAAAHYRSTGRPWTAAEDALVRRLAIPQAARRLGRSPRAVANRRRFVLGCAD